MKISKIYALLYAKTLIYKKNFENSWLFVGHNFNVKKEKCSPWNFLQATCISLVANIVGSFCKVLKYFFSKTLCRVQMQAFMDNICTWICSENIKLTFEALNDHICMTLVCLLQKFNKILEKSTFFISPFLGTVCVIETLFLAS